MKILARAYYGRSRELSPEQRHNLSWAGRLSSANGFGCGDWAVVRWQWPMASL
jgi:hypothetical protein